MDFPARTSTTSPWLEPSGNESGVSAFRHLALVVHLEHPRAHSVQSLPEPGPSTQTLQRPIGQKPLCPIKAIPQKSKAKEAGLWVIAQKRATPAKDKTELLSEAMVQYSFDFV